MSVNLEAVKFNQAVLTSNDGSTAVEISPYITAFDYFEDILSPSITAQAYITDTAGLYNGLPIRSGERLDLEIANLMGTLSRKDDHPLYVTGVSISLGRVPRHLFYTSLLLKQLIMRLQDVVKNMIIKVLLANTSRIS